MASSLSNLVNDLSERIHEIKCKYGHNDKKLETCRIRYKYWNWFLEHTDFRDDLREYKCLCCNKNYKQKFDENLQKRFLNTYKFSKHGNNKFTLMNYGWLGKIKWNITTWKRRFL